MTKLGDKKCYECRLSFYQDAEKWCFDVVGLCLNFEKFEPIKKKSYNTEV
ncbi:hypothetical protein LCGC14_2629130 [marine sediment metagenome]|uniref:Uncharacterized protein n=1 Tax=marine sediment metagenome TaxID=412755 RepID=A0A0F9CTA9_9ZZZZ